MTSKLQSHRQRASSRHLTHVAGLLLLLSLTACISDNEAQIAQCRRELVRDQPAVAQDPRTFYFEHGDYMALCMKAHGYLRDVSPAKCDPDVGSIFENPYCYAPIKTLPRWVQKVELFFKR